ncbi:MAG: hypothetical protein ACI9C1_003452 [Candidatus Aldehydirespiratoraceae bacterium]
MLRTWEVDRLALLSELPEVLTVDEVAAALRIGRSAAYGIFREWETSAGKRGLRCFRIGRSLRTTREHLLGYIASGGSPTPHQHSAQPAATIRQFPQRSPRRIAQAR